VKRGLILEKEAGKSTYLYELNVRKLLVVSISQRSKELRLQPALEFEIFKPWLESIFFKCISWLNGSFLWSNGQGFGKRVKESRFT
jgi:hypothetical protein